MSHSNENSTNTGELPAFSRLKPFQQRAVVLKANGKRTTAITNQINAEFELAYSVPTVAEWFYAGGKLEAALVEYQEKLAEMAISEARRLIRRNTLKSAETLVELQDDKYLPMVRMHSAKALLNKFIPDKQVVMSPSEAAADDLPDELADAGDKIVKGEDKTDGPKPVDDTPEGGEADQGPGAGGSEEIPAELLQEQAPGDGSGDPPA
jgi:hypothetical protein